MHKQREGVWEHAPPAQSRFLDFFLFDVSSATWKSANSHASDTQTHALTCRLHTSLLTQTRCRQKIKRDLLKVGGNRWEILGASVMRWSCFWCVCATPGLLSQVMWSLHPAQPRCYRLSTCALMSRLRLSCHRAVSSANRKPCSPDSALDAPGIIIRIKSFQ